MKTHSLEQLQRSMTHAEREAARKKADEILAADSVRHLREARGLTQDALGARMRANQATVSKFERRDDFSVDTLRRYIEALGGRLVVRAEFPDEIVELDVGSAPQQPANDARAALEEARVEREIATVLQASGWDPYDARSVRRGVSAGETRFDLVLYGARAPLAAIEVRSTPPEGDSISRFVAAVQGVGAPAAIFTCGDRHWICDTAAASSKPERIQRLPSVGDLERLVRRSSEARVPLRSQVDARSATDAILLPHQLEGARKVASAFDEGQRRLLVAMAPGTGRSGLCAALIRASLESRNAERVLVIVDKYETGERFRTSLVNHGVLERLIVSYGSPRTKVPEVGRCVVVATVAALSRNGRYKQDWSPFEFDLIVDIDANRAPHVAGRDVVQYFLAPRLGIISSIARLLPPNDSKETGMRDPRAREARRLRDTYAFFGCQPGKPTFLYDFDDVARETDSALVLPIVVDAHLALSTSALAGKGWDWELAERDAAFRLTLARQRIFTKSRNIAMVRRFYEYAKRQNGEIGRSIIFALNHEHAVELTAIFNELLMSESAVTITSRVPNADAMARAFAAAESPYSIAVGVDLLASGLAYRNLPNVGLMRPVFSAREYELLKGCAVRVRGHDDGEPARLIDLWRNAEYFGETYQLVMSERPDVSPSLVAKVSRAGSLKDIIANVRVTFQQGVKDLYRADAEFRANVDAGNDDSVEKLLFAKLIDNPSYSGRQVAAAYGVPAPLAAMVYDVLDKMKLPDSATFIRDTIATLSDRFDLDREQEALLEELIESLISDKRALRNFMNGGASILAKLRFRRFGILRSLNESILDALRECPLLQNTLLATDAA